MRRLIGIFFAATMTACTEAPPAQTSHAAMPIKSACTAGSLPPGSVGFDVRPGRRQTNARTLFVTNLSGAEKRVEVLQISRAEGACTSDWARTTPLDFVDAVTCKAPEPASLPASEWLELHVGDQRVLGTWSCTKLGLALWLSVDGQKICADAGAWIAEGEPEPETEDPPSIPREP